MTVLLAGRGSTRAQSRKRHRPITRGRECWRSDYASLKGCRRRSSQIPAYHSSRSGQNPPSPRPRWLSVISMRMTYLAYTGSSNRHRARSGRARRNRHRLHPSASQLHVMVLHGDFAPPELPHTIPMVTAIAQDFFFAEGRIDRVKAPSRSRTTFVGLA